MPSFIYSFIYLPVIFLPPAYNVHKHVLLTLMYFELSPYVKCESLKPAYLFFSCFVTLSLIKLACVNMSRNYLLECGQPNLLW